MCVLELVYSQPLALRKNVHQSWPLALNFYKFYGVWGPITPGLPYTNPRLCTWCRV